MFRHMASGIYYFISYFDQDLIKNFNIMYYFILQFLGNIMFDGNNFGKVCARMQISLDHFRARAYGPPPRRGGDVGRV